MKPKSISIIFPVHNEAAILRREIERFITECKSAHLRLVEIILVENGSQDSSWQIIKNLARKYKIIVPVYLPRGSYGQAVKAGLIHSRHQYVFVFNVDFFDINFILNALPLLASADIIIGSKTLAASQDLRSPFRKLTTYFFNVFLRLFLNYPGSDTHGIKAFKNTPLLHFCIHRNRTQNELFDTELVIRAHRWGAVLVELPVTVKEIRPTRYPWSRRIMLTAVDLLTAFWSKYLIPSFSNRIVAGDDYGRSAEINQAIISAAQSKVIQIISVLPNMVSTAQIKKLTQFTKGCRYSAHINLVEGKPVASISDVNTLVTHSGQFWPLPLFLTRLLLGFVSTPQITLEIKAQIAKLHKLHLPISHLDSHRHTHLFAPIWKIVLNQANQSKVSEVRSQKSIRHALRAKPIKYLAHLPIWWLLRFRFGANRDSALELDEIVMHPGAAYYD